MNIALIGYGRMGHEIETIAKRRGHSIKLIVDQDNTNDLNDTNLKGVDVAIEFSSPETAFKNIIKCFSGKVSVVSGTTGWLDDLDKAFAICKENNAAFIYSSNFSIGVNLLFKLNDELAKYMASYPEYKVSIDEIHHTKKLDAPSGTAITLANGISANHLDYSGWCFENEQVAGRVPIQSLREGNIPGTHTVTWDSEIDILSLKHEARSREGFALGAVVAAEFIYLKQGIFTMKDVMGF